MPKIGIIGGSGLYDIRGLQIKKRKKITTPFGSPSDYYLTGRLGSAEVVFLPRHGSHHNIPPHMINFRANIWGFKKLGVSRIISVSAVGGIKKGLKPGNLVIPDQIIDMTKNRKSTFYDGKTGVVHIDFTNPYCYEMRRVLLKAGRLCGISLKNGGTYAATEGPRLESAGEIRMLGMLGGDIVGMTGMPEAALARELQMCYAGICAVANYAAGITKKKLTTTEVMESMRSQTEKIKKLLSETFRLFKERRECPCGEALKNSKI